MLQAIPNQPLDFVGSALLVACPDQRLALAAMPDDLLRFQVVIEVPAGPYGYGTVLRDWLPAEDWGGAGSWVSYEGGAVCAPDPAPGAYMQPIANILNPTVGVTYMVVIDVQSITGTCTFSMAGQTSVISAAGEQTITLTAATTDGPRITLDNSASRICFGRVRVHEVLAADGSGCLVSVDVVNADTDAVELSISTVDRPELFAHAGGVLQVSVPLADFDSDGKCLFLRIYDACGSEDGLCSQPIRVSQACGHLISIRACLDYPALGFAAPAIFEARVPASLVRPRWAYDTGEERWSDGTIHRYYVDRQRLMDLLIRPVDEALHPWLASLCMFDHVYLDGVEYVVDADGYEPAYGDSLTGTAAVSLAVRPKREILRRVSCATMLDGCAPSTDPQCAEPNVQVNTRYDATSGGYFVEVVVYSALGFLPDRVIVTVNGSSFANEAWSTPTSYQFGPMPLASLITIAITNATEPSCDWSTTVQLPLCEGPGFARFSTTSVDAFDITVINTPGQPEWFALRPISDTGPGPAAVMPTGAVQEISGSPVRQAFCLCASDGFGNPIDELTELVLLNSDNTQNSLLELDVTGLRRLEFLALTNTFLQSLDLSQSSELYVVSVADSPYFASLVWPPGPAKLMIADFTRDPLLVSLPQLDPALIEDGSEFRFTDCGLDLATVSMLIQAARDSGKMFGYLYMSGGTNAPPPASGPIYDALQDLITLQGWDVQTN